jgi:DNA gyrase/topoisomerase IV subunit A
VNDDNITWVTINGQHIPIGAHETKDEAVKRFLKNKKEDLTDKQYREIEEHQKEKDKLNEDRKIVSTQEKHSEAVKELSQDKYPDGTYDTGTYKPVEYDNGYQVTFCQIGDNYNAKEYDEKVNEFLSLSSDGRVSAGKFESTPEISFHVTSREQAVALAKKYNQISIWDWKNCDEIKTGGTGRRK